MAVNPVVDCIEASEKMVVKWVCISILNIVWTSFMVCGTPYFLTENVEDCVKKYLWFALLVFVYYTPCLYWRAGDEIMESRLITSTMRKKYEKPPITYLKVLEHHGFCKPKICSWPSFTKSYSVANSYAVCTETSGRDTPIDVSLVFCIYTVKTSTVLSKPID